MKPFVKYLPIILLLAACTKIDVPEPSANQPVFSLDLNIDGQQEQWAAGIAERYMYTDFYIDSVGVHNFQGVLQQEECPFICPPALQFEIRDFQIADSDEVQIAQALSPGIYAYRDQKRDTTISYRIQFGTTAFPNDPFNSSYAWTFSNGATSIFRNPNLNLDTADPISYSVEANLNGYLARRTGTVYFDSLANNCAVDFEAIGIQGGTMLQVTATQSDGVSPFTYDWDPAAQQSGSAAFYSLDTLGTMGISLPELICLTQTDAQGCTVETCNTVFYDTPTGGNINQTSLMVNAAPDIVVNSSVVDYNQFSKVRLTYHDPGGAVFQSDWQEQVGSAFFEILESQPFEENENGLPTYQLSIRFQATLWDEQDNPLTISGEGTIAVAYPE
jgi:hypothetical protein